MTAFRETVVRELRVTDNTFSAAFILAGHPLGIATIRILTMIQFVCDGGDKRMRQNRRKFEQKIISYSLTLYAPISQNGHTHSNNSSAICRRIV